MSLVTALVTSLLLFFKDECRRGSSELVPLAHQSRLVYCLNDLELVLPVGSTPTALLTYFDWIFA